MTFAASKQFFIGSIVGKAVADIHKLMTNSYLSILKNADDNIVLFTLAQLCTQEGCYEHITQVNEK